MSWEFRLILTVTRDLSFRREIDGSIILRTMTNNVSAQQKQCFVIITDEKRLGLAKYFLNTNNRDFDILVESLGKILDKKLK